MKILFEKSSNEEFLNSYLEDMFVQLSFKSSANFDDTGQSFANNFSPSLLVPTWRNLFHFYVHFYIYFYLKCKNHEFLIIKHN